MELQLSAPEARVLGALLEKETTTPEYYPLSLNALVNACNQKSNRDPVVSYDEETVEVALESLRHQGLALRVTGADNRVPKHAQKFTEALNLGRREAAVLCVLLLRGPQTVGELRGRTERMYPFDDLEAVESTLNRLAEWETGALVQRLPRQSGFKEVRYAHLLCGPVEQGEALPLAESSKTASVPFSERLAALENEVAELKRMFAEFKRQFE